VAYRSEPITSRYAEPLEGTHWLALLLEPADSTATPGSAQCEAGIAAHGEFGAAAGDHNKAGGALQPPTTATTVRVRDGKTVLTDGPYVEGAEVANGFYLLSAADQEEAVKLASMISALPCRCANWPASPRGPCTSMPWR
jgi:hypothetical protein